MITCYFLSTLLEKNQISRTICIIMYQYHALHNISVELEYIWSNEPKKYIGLKALFCKILPQYRYRKVHEMFDLAKVEFSVVVWSVRPLCWQQCCWRRCCRRLLSGGRITVCLVAVSSPGLLRLLPGPGLATRASNDHARIMEKDGEGPTPTTRAFCWLKVPTSFHT